METDIVIVPLRVSRDQRRAWRVEAGKQDKSVQRWILDKITSRESHTTVETAQLLDGLREASGGKKVVIAQGKVVKPEPEFKCRVCGKPTNGDFVCKGCVK